MRHSYWRLVGGKRATQIGGGFRMIFSRTSVNNGPIVGNYRTPLLGPNRECGYPIIGVFFTSRNNSPNNRILIFKNQICVRPSSIKKLAIIELIYGSVDFDLSAKGGIDCRLNPPRRDSAMGNSVGRPLPRICFRISPFARSANI